MTLDKIYFGYMTNIKLFSFDFSKELKKIIFLCLITFPVLAQSGTPEISCNQTANINQFKASITAYANELNIKNIDQLNKYLDGQVIEETNTKVSIRTSLITAKKYLELSKNEFNSPSFIVNYKLTF